jgi:hypothetical protein
MIVVNVHQITKVRPVMHFESDGAGWFDSVDIISDSGVVKIFLPPSTGQAVADAISAAIATKDTE